MDNPQKQATFDRRRQHGPLVAAEVLGTEMIARVRPTYVERLRLMLADWEITTDAAVKTNYSRRLPNPARFDPHPPAQCGVLAAGRE